MFSDGFRLVEERTAHVGEAILRPNPKEGVHGLQDVAVPHFMRGQAEHADDLVILFGEKRVELDDDPHDRFDHLLRVDRGEAGLMVELHQERDHRIEVFERSFSDHDRLLEMLRQPVSPNGPLRYGRLARFAERKEQTLGAPTFRRKRRGRQALRSTRTALLHIADQGRHNGRKIGVRDGCRIERADVG